MASKPTALIVGAGIAGLSAAWWLDKAGWNSILIEKAPDIRDGGYLIGLSGPCLGTIKDMNLEAQVDDISYKLGHNLILDNQGRKLLRVAYDDLNRGLGNYALCRGDLARVLYDTLPETATIRYDETLEHAIEAGDKIQATLKSGQKIEVDLLIGADGIRSSVRSQFWKDEDCMENTGYFYAVYDVEQKEKLEDDCVSFNSPGHFDIFYSLRDNRLSALHIWREDERDVTLQSRQRRFETLRATTARAAKQVTDVVDFAEETDTTIIIDSLTMVSLKQWSKGRVLLLGDAAHCLTLMSAQGAGMALTSAEILGKELMSSKDLFQALANHEKKLRPIIERLQQRTRNIAVLYIPRNWLLYCLRNLMFKIMPYSWIVYWHRHA